MDYDSKNVFERYEEIAISALKEVHAEWWEQYQYNTHRIKSILNSLKIDLARSDNWKTNPERFWTDMRVLISRLQQWVRSLKLVDNELSFDKMTSAFEEKFNSETQNLPSEIRILIGDFYWQVKPDDKFIIKLRKRIRPLGYRLSKLFISFKNIFRNISQKPPIKNHSAERIIMLQDFLRMHLAIPVFQFFKDEWSHYLKTVLGQYFIVYGKSSDLLRSMLLSDRTEKIINSDDENIFNTLYLMAEILKEIDITFESVNDYDNQFSYRFNKFWQDLSGSFSSAWERAGTFQLPYKKYSREAYTTKHYKLHSRFVRDMNGWEKQARGLIGEWQKNLSLTQLGLNSSVVVLQGAHRFNKNISEKINPELNDIQRQINQMLARIEKIDSVSTLQSYYNRKLREFSQVRFSQLLDTIAAAQLPTVVGQALDTIKLFHTEMTPSVDIFIHRDTSNVPPRSKIRAIGLNKLVTYNAFQSCEQSCQLLLESITDEQDDIYKNISQLGRLIEFQFESAIQLIAENALDERLEEAKLIIRDTLAKSEHQLTDLVREIEKIDHLMRDNLPEKLGEFTAKLIDLFSSENLIMENIQLVKQQNKRKRKIMFRKVFTIIKDVSMQLISIPWKFLKHIFKTYFSYPLLEKKPERLTPIKDSVARFLRETTDKIAQLPYIYRKLFLFSPLTSFRFYAARKTEYDELRNEFSRWEQNKRGMVAMIGELGSGKTTILNMAKSKIFKSIPTIHMTADDTLMNEKELCQFLSKDLNTKNVETLKALQQSVLASSSSIVCLLENLNLLFPKTVRGMELLEQLMGFMMQTQSRIFWVVTCSSYSWHYLRKTVRAEQYFQRIIMLGEFSNGDIRTIILNRHRLSGFDLLFESNGNNAQNKKLKKLQKEDRQEFLSKQYFQKLNEISAGNVSVAMLYWLRSIVSIQDDTVVLNTSLEFKYDFLQNLSQFELFTLAAIINFDSISVADHAHLFNQSEEQSGLQLNQMLRYGILLEENSTYLIHPFLYRHLVALLKSKNILH